MTVETPDTTLTLLQQKKLALGIPLEAKGFYDYTLERDEIFKDLTEEQFLRNIEEIHRQRKAAFIKTGA